MNNWNESDWFKTWLALARQGQNVPQRPESISGDSPTHDRFGAKSAGSGESVPAAEWQVAE